MNINNILAETEKRWQDELFGYVRDLFSREPIPSHDHYHHLRVWKYAAGLLLEIDKTGKEIQPGDVEDLIIACFFHDTGLVENNGPDHGKASRRTCEEYFNRRGTTIHNRKRVLEAIGKHDDKTYQGAGPLYDNTGLNILRALAVCDDLDAFGRTGVYRYAEIYLMRGIPMEDLGLKIMSNLSGRFANFIATCSFLPEIIRLHVPRHNLTEDFYRNYNLQLRLIEKKGSGSDTGPVGVVREIFRHTMSGTPDIPSVADSVIGSHENHYITEFFSELKKEVQSEN
ncbi:MAG TPA: HD domain-containing protein [Bacteroidales bacterium]|nr:HD domain-containing protein [Bacteroidales bacterium]